MMVIIPNEKELYKDYIQRILDSRDNVKDKNEYQECHHIIPKCLQGSNDNDNLIYLYAQEHYYAHKLLALENPNEDKLQYAWWNMCHCQGATKEREYMVDANEYAEARQRFSKLIKENYSGENAYWYGKKQSKESNIKRSNTEKGDGNPMYGKHHTEEALNKIRIKRALQIGANHPKAKAVFCIETGKKFCTATEAAKFYGLKSRSSITLCCKGDKESADKDPTTKEKLHWKYVDN